MAKKTVRGAAAVTPAAIERQIDAIRRPFMAYATAFGRIMETRGELAPRFMRAYYAWANADGKGGFVAFVRKIDPEVPTASRSTDGVDGYRDHPSYNAAQYLRRKVEGGNRQPARRSNVSPLARMIATVLQVIRPENATAVVDSIGREFGFTARQITRLQELVGKAQPVMRLPGVRPVAAPRLVHVALPTEGARKQAAA